MKRDCEHPLDGVWAWELASKFIVRFAVRAKAAGNCVSNRARTTMVRTIDHRTCTRQPKMVFGSFGATRKESCMRCAAKRGCQIQIKFWIYLNRQGSKAGLFRRGGEHFECHCNVHLPPCRR